MDDIYQQILDWSKEEKPLWLRDALRRFVEKNEFTEKVKGELFSICLAEYNIKNENIKKITPVPLSKEHVPQIKGLEGPIKLLKLSNFQGINKITDEAILKFEPDGLTIVYGVCGTGKSGYVRLLKKMCRTRGSQKESIYSNIFSDDGTMKQSAKIVFSENDKEDDFFWSPGNSFPEKLSAISVFDNKSATTHVSEKNDLAYQPFGLDLLTNVSILAVEFGSKLRILKKEEEEKRETFDEFSSSTSVYRTLQNIPEGISEREIQKLFVFGGKEEEKLKELKERLNKIKSDDPAKEIEKISGQIRHIEELNKHICVTSDLFSEKNLKEIISLREVEKNKKNLVEVAAVQFQKAPVSGVGSDTWKDLWNSARKYHEIEAYPSKQFPVDEDTKCLLCQQELSSEAKKQLLSFEEFVKADVQKQYREALKELNEKKDNFDIEVNPKNIILLLEDLKSIKESTHVKAEKLIKILEIAKQTAVSLSINPCSFIKIDIKNEVTNEIENEILPNLNKQKRKLEELLKDKKIIESLEKEVDELKDLKKATQITKKIKMESERKRNLRNIEKGINSTSTATITRKVKELSALITKELGEKFDQEIKVLDVGGSLNIKLEASGAKLGVAQQQIFLSSVLQKVPINEILSDGEHRAVALSAFLTETSLSPHNSALIFDDPVSSLDHERKEKIAKRLTEEGKLRQIIIFTHDLPFIYDLKNSAEKMEIPINYKNMFSGHSDTGRIEDDLPWDGKTAEKRLKELREDIVKAKSFYKDNEISTYNDRVKTIYTKLRETWERAIEDILFNEVVQRFDKAIHTKKLKKVDIIPEDYKKIKEEMSKCSGLAHAAPLSSPTKTLKPEEIEKDIEILTLWIKGVKDRRQNL